MGSPKKSTGIRLTGKQIRGLKAAARQKTKSLKKSGLNIKIGYTTLVGVAVDELLERSGVEVPESEVAA